MRGIRGTVRVSKKIEKFYPQIPGEMWKKSRRISWKSLNDQYNKLIANHRIATLMNMFESGIVEVRGKQRKIMDEILLKMVEKKERRTKRGGERTVMESRRK